MVDMTADIGGLKIKNPVIAASGTFGFGREYAQLTDISRLGGISVKGLTLKPRAGNPPPRSAETPSGMLNSVGLQNPGVEAFIKNEIPFLRRFDTAVIANVAGSAAEDYIEMCERLSDADIDAVELNISCPNVKEGCLAFGATPEGVRAIVSAVRPHCKKPLIVKLTPGVADIALAAQSAEAAGADAVSLINTLLGMAIDIKTRRPVLKNNTGGLSGPAVRPVAVRMTYQAAQAVKIPVIGMGGIACAEDAVEFLLAGASAVMIGTAGFANPSVWIEVSDGIEQYAKQYGFKSVAEIKGALEIWR